VAHARLDVFCIRSRAESAFHPMHVIHLTVVFAGGGHPNLLFVLRVAKSRVISREPVMLL
jgi:hypothetical protein